MTGNVFRLFVSSTFTDMRAERDVLQASVWPRLRAFCEARGARFQAIDLRWGISEEAGLDQQTLAICLDEIRRCQDGGRPPNFLVLLGDRYGWRPVPASVRADDYDTLAIDPALREAYRLDANAVPPVYRLLPWADRPDAATREADLRTLWGKALDAAGWPAGDPRRHPFDSSATHQEIVLGALAAVGAERHVLAYVRELDGLTAGPFGDFANGARDPDAAAALDRLRAELRAFLAPGNCLERRESLPSWPVAERVAEFADWVAERLESLIAGTLAVEAAISEEQREIASHRAFAEERAKHFVGRAAELRAIGDYLTGPTPETLLVYGPSGSGKSALCALVEATPGAVVVRRFVGATPASTHPRTLLAGLCHEIATAYGDDRPIPQVLDALRDDLPVRLALATADRPLVVIVDGVDQLARGDDGRSVPWIPRRLPPHAKLLVSVLADEAPVEDGPVLQLTDLSSAEGDELLSLWLADAGRTLQPAQREVVLAGFARCPRPLYLRMAFEEARRWPSDFAPEPLSADIAGLIGRLFDRLELGVNHGPTLVGRTLGYLAAVRNGLAETELLDILAADREVMAEFVTRSPTERAASPEARLKRLPDIVWSRLLYDLRPYLAERDGDGARLLGFYHRQLGEEAATRYLAGERRGAAHEALAGYFAGLPYFYPARRPVLRKASELFWHRLREARATGDRGAVAALALTPEFLEMKAEAGLAYELAGELRELAAWEGEGSAEQMRAVAELVGREVNVIAAHPTLLFQTTWNAGWSVEGLLPWLDAWRADRLRRGAAAPWLRSVLRPDETPTALRAVLRGHDADVRSVAVTPDGRTVVSGSRDGTVRVWDGATGRQRLVLPTPTASDELTRNGVVGVGVDNDGGTVFAAGQDLAEGALDGVLLWDGVTGHPLDPLPAPAGAKLLKLAVGENGIFAAAVTMGGDVVLWRGADPNPVTLGKLDGAFNSIAVVGMTVIATGMYGPIRAWRADTAEELWSLPVPEPLVIASLALSLQGWLAFKTGGYLEVVDLQEGMTRCRMRGHSKQVWCMVLTPEGSTLVTGADDHLIKLWDTATGTEQATLAGHEGPIRSLAVTADGGTLVSGSADGTVRVWDLTRATGLGANQSSGSDALCAAVSRDGSTVVSGHDDGTVHVWDAVTGTERHRLTGHTRKVRAVAVTPDGRTVVSGGSDRKARVWDADTGQLRAGLEGHDSSVQAVAVTADGKRIATGDEKTLRLWDGATGGLLVQVRADHAEPRPALPDPRGELATVVGRVKLREMESQVIVGGEAKSLFGRWDPRSGQPFRSMGLSEPDWDPPPRDPNEPVLSRAEQEEQIKRSAEALSKKLTEELEANPPKFEDLNFSPVCGLAFGADGRLLVSGTTDLTVSVWNCRTGDLIDVIEEAYVRPPFTPVGNWEAVPEEFTTAFRRADDGTPLGRVLGRLDMADASADGTVWAGVANGRLVLLRAEPDGRAADPPPPSQPPFDDWERRFGAASVAAAARLLNLSDSRWRPGDIEAILKHLGAPAPDFAALWAAVRPYLVCRGVEGGWTFADGEILRQVARRYPHGADAKQLVGAVLGHLDALPDEDGVRRHERIGFLVMAGRDRVAALWYGREGLPWPERIVLGPALARLARSPAMAGVVAGLLLVPGLDDPTLDRLYDRLQFETAPIVEQNASPETYLALIEGFGRYLERRLDRAPTDLSFVRDYGTYLGRRGRTLRDLGRYDEAFRSLESSAKVFQRLASHDPDTGSRWEDLFVSLHELRLLFDRVRDIPTASAYARRSWEVLCHMRNEGFEIAPQLAHVLAHLDGMYGAR